jgi:vacuolar-type H+-ATPase subunit H
MQQILKDTKEAETLASKRIEERKNGQKHQNSTNHR